jgi:hypothetical protein
MTRATTSGSSIAAPPHFDEEGLTAERLQVRQGFYQGFGFVDRLHGAKTNAPVTPVQSANMTQTKATPA